ncbi:MAG TPA: hypothetical protein VE401_05045 [Solirubrobacterales bacterium]|nr:hypothetical protein [Solirubrobacterales bacterium]
MSLEHVLDSQRVQAAQPKIGIDVPLWIDRCGAAAALVTDQIGATGKVLVDDLAEEDGPIVLDVGENGDRGLSTSPAVHIFPADCENTGRAK